MHNSANPTDDKSSVAFILEGPPPPVAAPRVAGASLAPGSSARSTRVRPVGSHVFADTQANEDAAVIDVHHQGSNASFLSFLADQPDGTSFELGAIVRQKNGVTLESHQGDFAEWHQRKAGERPFTEGDVVGFGLRGEISRETNGAFMLGVISRQAVVDGSLPTAGMREQFDTVAYMGIVPVKVRRDGCPHGPCDGDLLVPSGRNDGTAVVVAGDSQKTTMASQKLGVVLQGCEWSQKSHGEYELVSCAVISPTETINGDKVVRRPRPALWSCITVLLTLTIVGCVVVFGVDEGVIQPSMRGHTRASLPTAAELACTAAIQHSCTSRLRQVMAADETQTANRWVPGTVYYTDGVC